MGIESFKVVDAESLPPGQPLVEFKGHDDCIFSVAVSPDNALLASGSSDATVRIWNTQTGNELACLRGHRDGVNSVAFSPDGKRIVSGSDDKTVRIWNTHSHQQELQMKGHTDRVRAVSFSPDGATVASGSLDKTVRIWSVSTGMCQRILTGHTNWVFTVAFSPLGNCIASGSLDMTVRIWKASTGVQLMRLNNNHGVNSVSFSPDGTHVAVVAGNSPISIWNAQDAANFVDFAVNEEQVFPDQYAIAFSPDGTLLALGLRYGPVCIWDSTTGEQLVKLEGHSASVWSVVFSPRGDCIYSGSVDRTIWAWDISPNFHRQDAINAVQMPSMVLANYTSSERPIHAWHRESDTWWLADNKGWTRRRGWNNGVLYRIAEAAYESRKMFLFSQDRYIEIEFSERYRPSE
jgi:WD40 repeat protein